LIDCTIMDKFLILHRYKFSLILLLISFSNHSKGNLIDTLKTSLVIETNAEYPGGMENLYKLIEDSLRYPPSAKKDQIGGKIYVQFVVDTNGNAIDVHILRGLREDLDTEAVRLVSLLNGWKPATLNGKKVNTRYNMPLIFYPSKKWEKKYKKNNKK
jgi:TonB family protein